MLFSKTTLGFYLLEIHGENIPVDAIEISDALYESVRGKNVVADANGLPCAYVPPAPTITELSATVRTERNALLTASDWTQVRDTTDTTAGKWAPYRQALRDLPKQAGFPESITWPVAP